MSRAGLRSIAVWTTEKKNQPEKPSDNIHELNENTLQTTASVCHY